MPPRIWYEDATPSEELFDLTSVILKNDKAVTTDVADSIPDKWVDAKLLKESLDILDTPKITFTGIDLKPTENHNEFTVNLSWADDKGIINTLEDSTPIKIETMNPFIIASDFEATFTCINVVKISGTGTYLLVVDNISERYTSGDEIPAGTYTIYGVDANEVRFINDSFINIHIEKNSAQTDAYRMFYNLRVLTTFTANPTTFGNVISFADTWRVCLALTSFPIIDTSNATHMSHTWESCLKLTEFPLLVTSNVLVFRFTWRNCRDVETFPLIDTSEATTISTAWAGCSSLTSFPLIDTSNVVDMSRAWQGCSSLTSFPSIDTSNVVDMVVTWVNCRGLIKFPSIDISRVTNTTATFYGCTSLVCMGGFANDDISSTLRSGYMFVNTPSLLRPTLEEQAVILAGNQWLNDTSC